MSKHVVELEDEEIERIADGLSQRSWILDHCCPSSTDTMPDQLADKRLCDRLEMLLPPEVERAMWPDEVEEALTK